MPVRPRLLLLGLGLVCLGAAEAAASVPLLPHKATYNLVLDGSKPTGQIEDMRGQIDYEITGDACVGFSTVTRQLSERTTGDGDTLSQEVTSTAWEDGEGKSYKFDSVTQSSTDGTSEVEASVTREGADRLKILVTKPQDETIVLKGRVLMPTEHVLHVIAAGEKGERVLQAKVYDGASDAARVYETLTVIGRASSEIAQAPGPAKAALSGHTYYPVTVSYYEQDTKDDEPAYVMSFSLYDNGVVGNLKIDYGRFALLGTMSSFEALKPQDGVQEVTGGLPLRVVHVTLRGRVQGVGYRAWCAREARERGLLGWVRNRAGGAVEAVIAGAPEKVAAMVEACRGGPLGARVDDLLLHEASEAALAAGGRDGFTVLETL